MIRRRSSNPAAPALVVTEIGVRPEHRSGLSGPHLAAALCADAIRLGVGDLLAVTSHPRTTAYLRQLGFRVRPKPAGLLWVPP